MNKTELIAAMSEEAGLTKKDAEKALDAFIHIVGESLAAGDKVQLLFILDCYDIFYGKL